MIYRFILSLCLGSGSGCCSSFCAWQDPAVPGWGGQVEDQDMRSCCYHYWHCICVAICCFMSPFSLCCACFRYSSCDFDRLPVKWTSSYEWIQKICNKILTVVSYKTLCLVYSIRNNTVIDLTKVVFFSLSIYAQIITSFFYILLDFSIRVCHIWALRRLPPLWSVVII